MVETPNHGYNVPEEGNQNWHDPLNANFETFELDIELRDVGGPTEGANDYDPADGAKYLDITTGEVYLGDGNTGSQAFSFGGSGGGGISSLSRGEGIDPSSIGDGDTVSVAWGDAIALGTSGDIADFIAGTGLDASGNVTGGTPDDFSR